MSGEHGRGLHKLRNKVGSTASSSNDSQIMTLQNRQGGAIDNKKLVPGKQERESVGSISQSILSEDDHMDAVELEDLKHLVTKIHKDRGKSAQMVKILVALSVPLIALLTLSGITLHRIYGEYSITKEMEVAVLDYLHIDTLLASLQLERDTSSTYVSSDGDNQAALRRLWEIRDNTDVVVRDFENWPDDFTYRGDRITTRELFLSLLETTRSKVTNIEVTNHECILMYTHMTKSLMRIATTHAQISGYLWSYLVSASAMVRASDAMGIQRALGSIHFTVCSLSGVLHDWFIEVEGEMLTQEDTAFLYTPSIEHKWNATTDSTISSTLALHKSRINNDAYTETCRQQTRQERFENALVWFADMTTLMNDWKVLTDDLLLMVEDRLLQHLSDEIRELVLYTVLIILILVIFILALVFSIRYARSQQTLTGKIARFARQMTKKSLELTAEKKKTETLLYQMLPRTVANELRVRKEVPPNYHDNVTIYLSNIIGFNDICSKSNPMEVVCMLNKIYNTFDTAIGRYNVYKVETIVDSYMVASGVPHPNTDHAKEVCLMALDIVRSASSLTIPHLPEDVINVRIGIHSGSCVAGVVGLKMPKYCLFGDALNIASRIEETSQAMKIHISEKVKYHLNMDDGFKVVERGDITMKGRAAVKTFWLLAYQADQKSTVKFE